MSNMHLFFHLLILPFIYSNGISVFCKECAYWKKTGNVHCEEEH